MYIHFLSSKGFKVPYLTLSLLSKISLYKEIMPKRENLKRKKERKKERKFIYTSALVSVVRNLPANAKTEETGVQSLGREDPLEEGMTTHSSTLALRIP